MPSEEIGREEESIEMVYGRILRQIDSLGIPREYVARRLAQELEPGERYLREELQEQLEKLPYEDFVSLTYRALERHGRTPIDLTYDLLNEMARELYQQATGHPGESTSFTLNFEDSKVLAEQLKKLRTSLKIRMLELSKHSNISQPYISEIESHKYKPTIIALSEYLYGLKRASSRRQI